MSRSDTHEPINDNAADKQERIPGLIPGQLTFSRKGFCAAYGIGPTTFHQVVKTGQLKVHKVGRRTLISVTEAERWFQSCAQGPK